MKMKPVFLSAVGLLLSAVTASAQDSLFMQQGSSAPLNRNNIRYVNFGSKYINDTRETPVAQSLENELSPTYLNSYSPSSLWSSGWFMSASVAGSAFVGDPIGCDDLFGRVRPALQAGIGKWLIPSVGARVQYQGYDMKSGLLTNQKYHSFSSDIMVDMASIWNKSENGPSTSVIPFAGCGYMFNSSVCSHSFGLHYGLIGSMRLSQHFSMNLELSVISTFKNFDGEGDKCHIGDHLLNASLGISYSLGSKQWRHRTIDARPYMDQNSRLLSLLNSASQQNAYLTGELEDRDRMLAEYRKILNIKGWLSDVGETIDPKSERKTIGYPYNNYSGLNALRDRIRNGKSALSESLSGLLDNDISAKNSQSKLSENPEAQWFEDVENNILAGSNSSDSSSQIDCEANAEYLELLLSRKTYIGAPILFFFNPNSTRLTDMSQLVNLKEIAQIAQRYNLHIRIVGAADSATGTAAKNLDLSNSRADYIEQELIKLGVEKQSVRKSHLGGIDSYVPAVANRNTRVELYF